MILYVRSVCDCISLFGCILRSVLISDIFTVYSLYIAGSAREDVEGARLKPSSDLVAAVSRTGRNEGTTSLEYSFD